MTHPSTLPHEAVGEGPNIQSGLSNADSLSKSEETPEDMQKKVAAAYELIQRMQVRFASAGTRQTQVTWPRTTRKLS